jgi:hypothetical protein
MTIATYDVSGRWIAYQSTGHEVRFEMQQNGAKFQGLGSFSGGEVNGAGEGRVEDNWFIFTIRWNNGSTGEYSGWFGPDGRITGHTFDVNNPRVNASWHSQRLFRRN